MDVDGAVTGHDEEDSSAPAAASSPAAAPETSAPAQTSAAAPAAPALTGPQQNALRSAQSYLKMKGFSRQGLIDQLSSEYADKYPVEDATVAVDSLNADWNAQAVRSATSYLKMKGFSCDELIQQLSSEYGDKYTVDQATFGAKQTPACQ